MFNLLWEKAARIAQPRSILEILRYMAGCKAHDIMLTWMVADETKHCVNTYSPEMKQQVADIFQGIMQDVGADTMLGQ